MSDQAAPHIEQMRHHLMETLAALRCRENPMEPDRARAIAQVASVMVDSAKAEVDYIKATGAPKSQFLEPPVDALPRPSSEPTAHNPFPVSKRHRLEA
jgi:hypothetical protein